MLALEFPPLSHIVNWPGLAGDGQWWEINKVVLVYGAAVLFTLLIFILGNKKQLVPTGAQNLAEMAVEFVEDGIVMETMGKEGIKYTPYLLSLFFFIFFTNIFEVIPIIQMPASARIALPMFLALLSYVIYHGAGFKSHGIGYIKHALVPPGVPVALLILVVPIEFISKFLVQPFSHTVRLFANLLAGHILLVTFAVLSSGLVVAKWYVVFSPLPIIGVIFFTAFEVLVSFLQAYVFTLLTGVYINAAQSHEH
ncbi:F0F1 ATP synthase subunit A [Aquihabitans sp. G128]|uniref:F0F1 ATP synthase subunit A n=1 Tax=Aquihabitans sp. G128 TaxID=2849779 RepID=UPI001C23DD36|nr:F0F1 ATP synthase subunit A [Aquihabitans sp. G128]QXC63166.1 F0F1 ATP synthase subunit A [Aquihabitans sp. G128]